MESFFHGKSSGLDPLNSYLSIPILIKSKDDINLYSSKIEKPQKNMYEQLKIDTKANYLSQNNNASIKPSSAIISNSFFYRSLRNSNFTHMSNMSQGTSGKLIHIRNYFYNPKFLGSGRPFLKD